MKSVIDENKSGVAMALVFSFLFLFALHSACFKQLKKMLGIDDMQKRITVLEQRDRN